MRASTFRIVILCKRKESRQVFCFYKLNFYRKNYLMAKLSWPTCMFWMSCWHAIGGTSLLMDTTTSSYPPFSLIRTWDSPTEEDIRTRASVNRSECKRGAEEIVRLLRVLLLPRKLSMLWTLLLKQLTPLLTVLLSFWHIVPLMFLLLVPIALSLVSLASLVSVILK